MIKFDPRNSSLLNYLKQLVKYCQKSFTDELSPRRARGKYGFSSKFLFLVNSTYSGQLIGRVVKSFSLLQIWPQKRLEKFIKEAEFGAEGALGCRLPAKIFAWRNRGTDPPICDSKLLQLLACYHIHWLEDLLLRNFFMRRSLLLAYNQVLLQLQIPLMGTMVQTVLIHHDLFACGLASYGNTHWLRHGLQQDDKSSSYCSQIWLFKEKKP